MIISIQEEFFTIIFPAYNVYFDVSFYTFVFSLFCFKMHYVILV